MARNEFALQHPYYAVRISEPGGEKLLGSGVLYVRNPGENPYIFTAGHVCHVVLKKKGDKKIHLDYSDLQSRDFSQDLELSKAAKGDAPEAGKVFYHPKFKANNKNGKRPFINDAAILVVEWEDWLKDFRTFPIRPCTLGAEQIAYGFPNHMNDEWTAEEPRKGLRILKGSCTQPGKAGEYQMEYDIKGMDPGVNRTERMQGYSGSGIFEYKDNDVSFSGVVSRGAGDEMNSGNILWAADSSLFLDILNENGIAVHTPVSLDTFLPDILKEIPKSQTTKKQLIETQGNILLGKRKLLAADFVKEENDFYPEWKCFGNRKTCENYWRGQFEKGILFSLICKTKKKDFAHPYVVLSETKKECAKIQFLCTEEYYEDVLASLVENGEYIQKDSSTIILWNDRESDLYNSYYSRGEIQNLVPNMPNIEDTKISWQGASDDAEEEEEEDDEISAFDIVKGDPKIYYLAAVGMGKLKDEILRHAPAEEKGMMRKMSSIWESIWNE